MQAEAQARVWAEARARAQARARARRRKRCASHLVAITIAGRQDVLAHLAEAIVPEPIARGLRRLCVVARHGAGRNLRESKAIARLACAATLLRRKARSVVELVAIATVELVRCVHLAELGGERGLKDERDRARVLEDAHLEALQLLRRHAEAA